MNVGFLTSAVSRAAGGVFPATCALANALEDSGSIALKVFGIADSYTETDRAAWRSAAVTAESPLGPRRFGFAPRLAGRLSTADLDLLHAHGLWMYPSLASLRWARKQRRPYIVSPHGMLDGWALRNSAWKKRIAAALFERRHLAGAACLHALTAAEAWSMRAYGLRNPVCVIPSGVDLPSGPPQSKVAADAEPRVLLYLGRLHPKKNIEALLRVWSSLRSYPRARAWRLVIAGWDDGGHLDRLRPLASENVAFVGPQFGAEKEASFARASAFILPSRSEGLPVAVLEAWAHSLPVLMTPQCNLPEGFAAGAAIPIAAPTLNGIRDALDRLFSTPDSELRDMGAKGRELVARRFSWTSIACEMRQVYEWVLGRGERPASVYAA